VFCVWLGRGILEGKAQKEAKPEKWGLERIFFIVININNKQQQRAAACRQASATDTECDGVCECA
jgi:hypothetical protein